ncbi:MAG TPA: hypothetical protein VG890_05505 [Puia sp.]|nr:hypothetical protein [Puia sp.]
MKYIVLLMTATILVGSCQYKKTSSINPPLATVVKVNAAEAFMDFEEAKKYQDINEIYSKVDKQNPEKAWKEMVTFFYNLSKDKKFTNQWKYYNYDITENINNKNAEVILKSKNKEALFQTITYKLDLRQSVWIINDIEYTKK